MTTKKQLLTIGMTPSHYKCQKCGASGVKLWRDVGPFEPIALSCCQCTAIKENKNIDDIDQSGLHTIFDDFKSDTIGSCVPAFPVEDVTSIEYWGYGSVPDSVITWWSKLPNSIQTKE